jgi:hypothetical protein
MQGWRRKETTRVLSSATLTLWVVLTTLAAPPDDDPVGVIGMGEARGQMNSARGDETTDARQHKQGQRRVVWSSKHVRKKENNRNNEKGIRVLFERIKLLRNTIIAKIML